MELSGDQVKLYNLQYNNIKELYKKILDLIESEFRGRKSIIRERSDVKDAPILIDKIDEDYRFYRQTILDYANSTLRQMKLDFKNFDIKSKPQKTVVIHNINEDEERKN